MPKRPLPDEDGAPRIFDRPRDGFLPNAANFGTIT